MFFLVTSSAMRTRATVVRSCWPFQPLKRNHKAVKIRARRHKRKWQVGVLKTNLKTHKNNIYFNQPILSLNAVEWKTIRIAIKLFTSLVYTFCIFLYLCIISEILLCQFMFLNPGFLHNPILLFM